MTTRQYKGRTEVEKVLALLNRDIKSEESMRTPIEDVNFEKRRFRLISDNSPGGEIFMLYALTEPQIAMELHCYSHREKTEITLIGREEDIQKLELEVGIK